jgi:hypothetical protein
MQAFDEAVLAFDASQGWIAHACHDAHVDDDVGTISDFDAAA